MTLRQGAPGPVPCRVPTPCAPREGTEPRRVSGGNEAWGGGTTAGTWRRGRLRLLTFRGWCLLPPPRPRGSDRHDGAGGRLPRRRGRCGGSDARGGPEVTQGSGSAGAMAEVEAAGSGAGGSPEAGAGTSSSGGGWRRPHGPLQRYYGPSAAEAAEAAPDPADINGPHFDPEVFLTKVTFDPTVTPPPPPGAPRVVVETLPADTPAPKGAVGPPRGMLWAARDPARARHGAGRTLRPPQRPAGTRRIFFRRDALGYCTCLYCGPLGGPFVGAWGQLALLQGTVRAPGGQLNILGGPQRAEGGSWGTFPGPRRDLGGHLGAWGAIRAPQVVVRALRGAAGDPGRAWGGSQGFRGQLRIPKGL